MIINKVFKLSFAIILSQLAGIVGSLFTASAIPTWYAELAKSSLTPPNWIFGPVWITLYLLMGVSAFLILDKGLNRKDVRWALFAFMTQLVLNTLWSIIFFGFRNPFWALVELDIMSISIIWTMILFYKISKPAMWLLMPYILWVSFAGYLNYKIWILN